MVYFIQEGPTGPIKIGCSDDPDRRRDQLQTAHAKELYLRAVRRGGKALEQDDADLREFWPEDYEGRGTCVECGIYAIPKGRRKICGFCKPFPQAESDEEWEANFLLKLAGEIPIEDVA